MRKKILILLVFIFIFNVIYGEEYFLQGIIFKGIKYASYSQIQELLNIKPFQSYSQEKIEKEINRIKDMKIFEDIKYFLNKINSGYELIIEVKEYPIIEKVEFPNIKLLKEEEIKRNIYSDVGRFFMLVKIEEDLNKIRDLYKKHGFPLKTNPKYVFENNILKFDWEELPPIKEIIYDTKSSKEEDIIRRLVSIKRGEDLNIKEIDLANQKLLRGEIPYFIKYNYKVEGDGTILYLYLMPLFQNSLTVSFYSPLNFNINYSFYNLNWGRISLTSLISKENNPLYKFKWEKENFHLSLENDHISLLFLKDFGKDIIAKVGYRAPLSSQGNKALLFSFEINTLIKRDYLNINGNLLNLSMDFVGGGSPENYTLFKLLTDNYWNYGEEFEERILEAKGELRYVLGNSQENSGVNIKFSYGFPIFPKIYIFLDIGGESKFKLTEIKSLSEIVFIFWGGLNFVWTNYPWIFKSSLIIKSLEKLNWEVCSVINF